MIKKAVIFDADGTLWDSVDLVAKAFSIKLQDFPETKGIRISREDLLPLMGKTMDQFAKSLIPQVEGKRGEEILAHCMQFENLYLSENKVQFYPHLEECIAALKAAEIGRYIVSNCQSGYIDAVLYGEKFTLGKTGDFLDMECYGNNGKKKAENIRILMERNHLKPEDCVYLGDTALDFSSATEAGIAFIHAAYGFGQVEGAERSISDLSELIHVLPFSL